MSVYDQFGTSEAVEKEGVWLEYENGVRIRVARAGGSNRRYLKAVERRFRTYRRRIQTGTMAVEAVTKILVEIFADTVILGWESVTDRDGNPIPFTRENCIRVMTDLPALFDDVQQQAANYELFLENILEDDAGN